LRRAKCVSVGGRAPAQRSRTGTVVRSRTDAGRVFAVLSAVAKPALAPHESWVAGARVVASPATSSKPARHSGTRGRAAVAAADSCRPEHRLAMPFAEWPMSAGAASPQRLSSVLRAAYVPRERRGAPAAATEGVS